MTIKKANKKMNGKNISVKAKDKMTMEKCVTCDRSLTGSELLYNGLFCNFCIKQRQK